MIRTIGLKTGGETALATLADLAHLVDLARAEGAPETAAVHRAIDGFGVDETLSVWVSWDPEAVADE